MPYRSPLKAVLKSILETIPWGTGTLAVEDKYITTAAIYPYCFITSAGLIPNKGGTNQFTLGINGEYMRQYEFDINLVFLFASDGTTESNMDLLEELILDKIQSRTGYAAFKAEGASEVQVIEITPSFQLDPQFNDNASYKVIKVRIDVSVDIQDLS